MEILSVTKQELKLRLVETGPIAIWSEHGAPQARGADFEEIAPNLYLAELPIQAKRKTMTIRR